MATFGALTKICCICKMDLSLKSFHKGAKRCKLCEKEYQKVYREKNKEKLSKKKKEYYQKNSGIIKARSKEYTKKNRDKINEQRRGNPKVLEWKRQDYLKHKEDYNRMSKEYRVKNKEKLAEINKIWIENNRDKVRAIKRKYSCSDRGKMKGRLNMARRRSLAKISTITTKDIAVMLNTQSNKCFYCDDELKEYHIDHIIPVSRGGEHKLYNIVLACPPCNHSKNNRSPEDFVNKILSEAV